MSESSRDKGVNDGKRVAIVGGGLLGMSMALRLAQAGAKVTLFEASGSPGGLAGEASFGSYKWDRYYHVVLLSDLRTRGLLEELGMADRLRWGISRTGFFTDGQLYSMSNTVEFLKFPPLSLIDKLRLGGTIFLGSKIRRADRLEKILAVDWLRRYSGKNVLERIWLPLLKSKLGNNYSIASAAFIWAIIARMYAARRSGLKQEMFGYISGGYGPVLRELENKLCQLGVDIRTNSAVRDIVGDSKGASVWIGEQAPEAFSRVVMTTPPHVSARLCSGLKPVESERLLKIPYQGVICAAVLLKKPLSSYYVTNITDRWVPFTGVIEMTALVDRSEFGGHSLVYLPLYLPQEDPAWDESDESIKERFLDALVKMYPEFSANEVLDFSLSRARQVLAISTLNYSSTLMPPVRQSVPNVCFINSAQIAHGTLNVNETLGLVDEHLADLTSTLGLGMPVRASYATQDTSMPELSTYGKEIPV
ncbi:MAG: NAD(P)/FAD-dependent oxidoreductase [Burkholderiaceae bacterium]